MNFKTLGNNMRSFKTRLRNNMKEFSNQKSTKQKKNQLKKQRRTLN